MKFVRVNNLLFDAEKVTYLVQENDDVNTVRIVFDNTCELLAKGAEAAEVWRLFDVDGDWRGEG